VKDIISADGFGCRCPIDVSMAESLASDVVARTAHAVQILGGSRYIRGFEVERLYRDATYLNLRGDQSHSAVDYCARAFASKGMNKPVALITGADRGMGPYIAELFGLGIFEPDAMQRSLEALV
jgi:hypothetical protein